MAKKILIIEDENFLAEMYRAKIKKEGYDVITAENGKIGLAKAQKEKPDLILLDLVMPEMDGYEVLKKLKSSAQTKNIIVYIFSNLAQSGEIEKGIKMGATGFLLKANHTPGELMEKIKKVFSEQKNNKKNVLTKPKITQNIDLQKEKNGKKILLIEDQEDIIAIYKTRLEKEGYEVKVARNGAWGIKLAKNGNFDIIILDMVMPAMSGYQAIKVIKSSEKTKNIPTIVLSNSAQDKDIEKAKKCGAKGFILKSQITPLKLTKEIKKII
jgi:CheY-like chemotaxis protein